MDEIKLKPCPFCGCKPELTTESGGYVIRCDNHDWPKTNNDTDLAGDIGLYSWGMTKAAKDALIKAWNSRSDNA